MTKEDYYLDALPDLLIMMDKEIGERHPDKVFWLRVKNENSIDFVNLDGAITPLGARQIAREKGYDPKHWMEVGGGRPWTF